MFFDNPEIIFEFWVFSRKLVEERIDTESISRAHDILRMFNFLPMNYWIGVVSLDHLERGIEKGIFAIGHGKKASLELMKGGDNIVFYLPKKVYGATDPENIYQHFQRVYRR